MDSHRRSAASFTAWNVQPRLLSFVVHFLGVVAITLVLIWTIHFRGGLAFSATNKNLIFNVHPVLMLLSLIFLASEGILVYRTVPLAKASRKVVHLSIHLVALVLGIVGVYSAFKYHNESNIDNLYSLHSWIGLITICLFGIQWLAGLVSFFFPGLSSPTRAMVLPWHVFFGLFIYGLATATAELGFLEKLTFLQSSKAIGRYSTEAILVNCLGLIVILLGVFLFLSAVVPNPHDEGYVTLE